MGEYAGELPRKFISFHCLENESNVPKDHNTEGTENFPDLPQRSEVEIVVIEETETSLTKSLAVLQVTGVKEAIVEERENVDKECLVVSSQECLLSSSDEGSEGLEKFWRDKLESFGGEGIENVVEVDPAGVLDLLDAKFMDRGNPGKGVVTVDDEIPRSRVDDILRSELREKILVVEASGHCVMWLLAWQMNDLRRVLHLTLMMRVVDCFLRDVLWLVCQMLVSHSQVVPDRMTQIMVHLSWSRLHEGELVIRVGGGFMRLQNQIFQVFLELQCSLVWVLGVQNITPASLQEPC